jgi:hypothetical protein
MFRAAVLIVTLAAPAAFAAQPSWIEESNRHSQLLLEVMARYNAEAAGSFGVEGHDGEVFDLKPRVLERQEADIAAAISRLEGLKAAATDPLVRRDLDILIGAAGDQKQSIELNRRLALPFFSRCSTEMEMV